MRDAAQKEALKGKLGPLAAGLLILTVHECKGLEFQVGVLMQAV